MTGQNVIDAFASVGVVIFNVGISGDDIHVDTQVSREVLQGAMDALGVSCDEIADHTGYRRGYFYPPSLKGWQS